MFESPNEVILSAIVVLSGCIVTVMFGRWLRLSSLPVTLLYLWHSALGFVFSNYVLNNGGDAFAYYQKALFGFVQADLGTDFVVWLTSFPTTLGFTYWPLSFLYNVIGSIGLVLFYAALKEAASPQPSRLMQLLVFVCAAVPSLSFWTSGIGKDSISLFSVGLFLWSITAFERRQVAYLEASCQVQGGKLHPLERRHQRRTSRAASRGRSPGRSWHCSQARSR